MSKVAIFLKFAPFSGPLTVASISQRVKKEYYYSALPILFLAIVLAMITVYRSATTSFSHDESFTYNHYVTATLSDIFAFRVISPNNHLLNTLLMKWSGALFGPSEWALRLPNVLALLGYLWFGYLLVRRLPSSLQFPVFALLNANPYLLDFFALARGNGMSLFFLLAGVYWLIVWAEGGHFRCWIWSLLYGVAGVLSHFSLLYFFLALIITGNIFRGFARGIFLRFNLVNLVALLLLAAIMTFPVLKMIRADQFFYGGEQGFWYDTVGTLWETYQYLHVAPPLLTMMIKALILIIVATSAGMLLFVLYRRDRGWLHRHRTISVLFLLLIFSVIINLTQFHLIGTRLLIRRYGLLYYPLFILLAGYLAFLATRRSSFRRIFLPVIWIFPLAALLHTGLSLREGIFLDWQYERDTRKMMERFAEDAGKQGFRKPVTMGIHWLYEPTINFYRQTRYPGMLNTVNRDGPSIPADYYYIFRNQLMQVPWAGLRPVVVYAGGSTVLIRSGR